MLEGLVTWVLNNYLGKYVENLNTDQLSIALLSGKVELENLPLKKDALRHFGLPIEIKSGFIGKIKLQIPIKQIRSAPWLINIEQLYLIASPVNEWDPYQEEQAQQERKLSILDEIEAKWRLETDNKDQNYYASSYMSWMDFGTGLVSDIVENLQLNIEDVHIRYEDSIGGKSVAFGIQIEALLAQSCDANWLPGFCSWTKNGHSYKLLEMQKFAVYWTDLKDETELLANLNLEQLSLAMLPSQCGKYARHYILPPVSTQAHVKRNRSELPLRSVETPRIVCDLVLEEVPLTLIDWQYDQIVKCIQGLETLERLRSYRHYRPKCTIKENPREWYLYVIKCLLPEANHLKICQPKPSWDLYLGKAKQNVEYVKIYQKILTSPLSPLTNEEKHLKDLIELERDLENLKILREISMKLVPEKKPLNNTNKLGRSVLVSWFPQWMGWYSTNTEETVNETALEGEILQVLTDTTENDTILKRDVVFGQFNFILKRGCLHLCTTKPENQSISCPMLELEFKNLSLCILSKPRTCSHLIELKLGTLLLKDKITENTLFPNLVGPPDCGLERIGQQQWSVVSPRFVVGNLLNDENTDLFFMVYEKKPLNSGCDYRLCIRTKCLDVVYQPNAVRWLTDFLCLPYQKAITQSRIEAMKQRTKKELLRNWQHILDGGSDNKTNNRINNRILWQLELDIAAPQIIFVEQFTDQNSAMVVIDFGRLQLSNFPEKLMKNIKINDNTITNKESEEDEMFMTPCSTPPQSHVSSPNSEQLSNSFNDNNQKNNSFSANKFHETIYDCYNIEMTDLQILIGKIKDNWRYAHNKGTSKLHVLDRFNIKLTIERRMIHTTDPQYPCLILNATLPKLVGHLNETKITMARKLLETITVTGLPSPFNTPETGMEQEEINILRQEYEEDNESNSDTTNSLEMSRLVMLQFLIDQLSLEVQSRGRSIAELQVSGVKFTFTKRPQDKNFLLTVHSLLLVDALQTFGGDFELLVASHKHVGMDTLSGSLRDSEPTSPVSPASPDSNTNSLILPSPGVLTQALDTLVTGSPFGGSNVTVFDAEALITIEVVIVTGPEPVQVANVQFNNLDIIANQETIVELIGFIQRVFPNSQKSQKTPLLIINNEELEKHEQQSEIYIEEEYKRPKIASTQLTFDFHRLNVLLLRAVLNDNQQLYGKKICTATMSNAKIQARIDEKLEIEGSLGGVHILDLTPEGQLHQRIISVGQDPFSNETDLYKKLTCQEEETTAFRFKIVRNLETINGKDSADIQIRMASLWYTHAPHLLIELQNYATEFKQYLKNLARSIRAAATDMALGLVHARAEALAQSLYINARLSSSIYNNSTITDCQTPRKRRKSIETNSTCLTTISQTPANYEDFDFFIDIKLDIELDSPVVVLPQFANSMNVFVAHLGKITVNNSNNNGDCNNYDGYNNDSRFEFYIIEIRDMNLFSVDTITRRVPGPMISKPEVLYDTKSLAKPILHDTILLLKIEREIIRNQNFNVDTILFNDDMNPVENINVSGSVVNDLKLSLSRSQYEQLLNTLNWLMSTPQTNETDTKYSLNTKKVSTLSDINEEDTSGVTTLNMDPHVRAKLFPNMNVIQKNKNVNEKLVFFKVFFELPIFTIELRGDCPTGEQGLVDLSFRDFVFNYEKCHRYETNIQVSLRSILMEDLLQPENSRQRAMVISSSCNKQHVNHWVSRSCPDINHHNQPNEFVHYSLPDHLEIAQIFGGLPPNNLPQYEYCGSKTNEGPCTPPPSPLRNNGRIRSENLVLISTLLVDSQSPNFQSHYNSVQRSTSIDFNCLDLVVSIESWVVVLDFFSASPQQTNETDENPKIIRNNSKTNIPTNQTDLEQNSETIVTVKSLTLVLMKPDREIAKANISNVDLLIKNVNSDKIIEGKLGSLSLLDLTLHGQLYRERFITCGKQALKFNYLRNTDYSAKLTIEMSSVVYVHTKRFMIELQAFFHHFTQLQSVMKSLRNNNEQFIFDEDEPFQLLLNLNAGSPIILLPVFSKSQDLLIIDLGQLLIRNSFHFSGDVGTVSPTTPNFTKKCLLDVMIIELENVDLYTGCKLSEFIENKSLKLGNNLIIRKTGQSLLLSKEKFQLRLQLERNLNNLTCHNVPDMTIYGCLSTLDVCLDSIQYRLIRGLLALNLGEDTQDLLPLVQPPLVNAEPNIRDLWTLSLLKLDLQNVLLRLQNNNEMLTCINFIRSHLTIENFSNLSQDIDLISQEILIIDTRFDLLPEKERLNIFKSILQPIRNTTKNTTIVQAEIHSRKRGDFHKVTVLLNSMRLMAIFDWWQIIFDYLLQDYENLEEKITKNTINNNTSINFELKLNITDCECVIVENQSQLDTNSVILKSTTVINYRPFNIEKPLTCNLNNCEMFSCILGKENETALSIIDPVTLNIDLNQDKVLDVQLQFLIVRLSYSDMCLFMKILNSLPKQMFITNDNNDNILLNNQINKLKCLGFHNDDCLEALQNCSYKLDDAALWLTQNASATNSDIEKTNGKLFDITAVEIRSNCISLYIIDDCGDLDMPLLEISFSEIHIFNNISLQQNSLLECVLIVDYYNRVFSGWEPFIEPWRCKIVWNKSLGQELVQNRLNIEIVSKEKLDVNITSTLMDLYKQVKENWLKDYFNTKTNRTNRSPFIPFAIKNETGSKLYYTTIITEMNSFDNNVVKPIDFNIDEWQLLDLNDLQTFSFKKPIEKHRHRDTHQMKIHQLCVKVEGWQQLQPVTIDRVGCYFRTAPIEHYQSLDVLPLGRVVFDITLDGTARKLITIRSAIQIINKLPDKIDLKFEMNPSNFPVWAASQCFSLEASEILSVPLIHANSQMNLRPTNGNFIFSQSINWTKVNDEYELRSCHWHKSENYRFCVKISQQLKNNQPIHVYLLPIIKILNLLPVDCDYVITDGTRGRLLAGGSVLITHFQHNNDTIDLNLNLENFTTLTKLTIPLNCLHKKLPLNLEDANGRKLNLLVNILPNSGAKLQIQILAHYWIVNKTGLPLVFRQAGTSNESAGQFQEHEIARMVTPLLFSFSDLDASHTINTRVGNCVIPDGSPQWSSNFDVKKKTQVKRLHVTMRDGRPDTVFIVGVEVRQGRGKYRCTSIITIAPRYQLYNQSSYKLIFAQKCFTKNRSDTKTCLKAMPNSHLPFHWPRLDKDQLLCVSIEDVNDCCWSGGLRIDEINSLHINIRDQNGRVYFLRLEILLQIATFIVIFTDADTLPPPIRIDNFSEVTITFTQTCNKDIMHSTARAHSSVPYAWDQPLEKHKLTLIAPGGVSETYNLNKLGTSKELTYENFIYIAFIGTFKIGTNLDPFNNVESQELVLDIDRNNYVILAKKQQGQRSQLWRMTSENQLQHEGSSPPTHPNQIRHNGNCLVLDIDGIAPQPNNFSRLMLRRIDPRRRSTQTWRFTNDGRLCCAHYNMCVQAQDGFFGLKQGNCMNFCNWQQWNGVVLGLPQPVCHKLTDKGIPIEQAIERQYLRPGSGLLSVNIEMDGPTCVVSIRDSKETKNYATSDDREWTSIKQRPNFHVVPKTNHQRELRVILRLNNLGISLVCCKTSEELLYLSFLNIIGELNFNSILKKTKQFCISIGDVQIDNQLLDCITPSVVLYMTPQRNQSDNDDLYKLPAIKFTAEIQDTSNENAIIFKHFILSLSKTTVILEEKLLLKCINFIGYHGKEEELISKKNENDFEIQRLLIEASAAHAKRYYFGVLHLIPDQIRLSVKTATKLPINLQQIKRKLGLTLIAFENAGIDLNAFSKYHLFETGQFLLNSIMEHFKNELMWQAGMILGSVDFLGNPLGLVIDLSEGVSGLLYEGNISSLFKNVTHGLSDSAVKITETVSDGIGRAALDDLHEEQRQRIRQKVVEHGGKSSDHLLAGMKGLGYGLWGGATGIFKQVYEGANNEGVTGIVKGMGKGLLGVVAKPLVGVLDFTSETARAVRDSSKSKLVPQRVRLPRCVYGPGGLLPRYSSKQSQGQQYLYLVNDKDYREQLIGYEILGSCSENLHCIVSNLKVRIVASTDTPALTPVIDCHLNDLEICNVIIENEGMENRCYIEIVIHLAGGTSAALIVNPDPVKRPRVRCKSADLAKYVAQQINYAKRLYIERLYTMVPSTDNINSED